MSNKDYNYKQLRYWFDGQARQHARRVCKLYGCVTLSEAVRLALRVVENSDKVEPLPEISLFKGKGQNVWLGDADTQAIEWLVAAYQPKEIEGIWEIGVKSYVVRLALYLLAKSPMLKIERNTI
jgi:hypothetical protein